MEREAVLVGIDAGTTKVTTLIGEVGRTGDVNVIGYGIAPSVGMKKGMVANIDQTVNSIGSSVEKAERLSGYKISSAFVAACPSRSTTTASGRSSHFGCGMAITAASSTAGWFMSAFSRATELIHSPPDLTRSLLRSWRSIQPRASIVTMSPVRSQPSSVMRSAASGLL